MRYLLDTNICSAHMRRPARLAHRFVQRLGQLAIPAPVLAELYAGGYRFTDPHPLLRAINALLEEVQVLDFDSECALRFGRVKGVHRAKGISFSPIDLMIASVALAHDLTLVTNNAADFKRVPDLRLEDWLMP